MTLSQLLVVVFTLLRFPTRRLYQMAMMLAFAMASVVTVQAQFLSRVFNLHRIGRLVRNTTCFVAPLLTTSILFSQQTGLPSTAAMTSVQSPDVQAQSLLFLATADQDMPAEIRFSDYRNAEGANFPFRIQRFAVGALELEVSLTDTTINAGGAGRRGRV